MTVQFGVDTICGPCKGSGVSHERPCLKCGGTGFLSGPTALARRTDPETSRAAAASISSERLRSSQAYVLETLRRYGPMTDEQLIDHCDNYVKKASPSGVRTRRHELEVLGLVYDTGRKAETAAGNKATVWAAR